ncbi:serine/threonine-protein kinase [Actinomyces slackii]|uniref:serine/threonine-protein kinase n=1 Tax=Actinomyces slackii TaxID=52774 RepID=UPI002F9277A1
MTTEFPPPETAAPEPDPGSRPHLADTLSTPYTIAGVQLHSVLGRGGFATVYAGIQGSLERPVAVKIDSRPLDDPRNKRRFMREVQAASRIAGHPHVVSLIDTGVLPDARPYLIMELCSGGSLADLVAKGPTEPADAVALVTAACSGLAAAHAAGVMHRDIKPANILLDAYGSPRLSDFGIASVEREGQDPTVTLECLTPDFAPPEAFMLSRPGPQGDVWSMGAVLFALLTGRGPRRGPDGVARSLPEIVRCLEDPLDLRDPQVPAAVLPLLEQAMAPEPEDRFASGRELASALYQVRGQLGAGRLTVSGPLASLRLAEAGPAASAASAGSGKSRMRSAGSSRRRTRRGVKRWPAALAGLAAGLALGAVGGWETAAIMLPRISPAHAASPGATSSASSVSPVSPASSQQSPAPSQGPANTPPAEVGACLSGIVSVSGVSSAREVDCSEPHHWEVFAVGTLAESTSGFTDADLAADPNVQDVCTAEAAGARGGSDPEITVLGPSEVEWRTTSNRGFSCAVATS